MDVDDSPDTHGGQPIPPPLPPSSSAEGRAHLDTTDGSREIHPAAPIATSHALDQIRSVQHEHTDQKFAIENSHDALPQRERAMGALSSEPQRGVELNGAAMVKLPVLKDSDKSSSYPGGARTGHKVEASQGHASVPDQIMSGDGLIKVEAHIQEALNIDGNTADDSDDDLYTDAIAITPRHDYAQDRHAKHVEFNAVPAVATYQGVAADQHDTRLDTESKSQVPAAHPRDLVDAIRGLYRVLDIVSEQGSGGLGSLYSLSHRLLGFSPKL